MNDHFAEEDWVDFAREQAAPRTRARLQEHLDEGCPRCAKTVRLWKGVLERAAHEADNRPPDEVLRQVRGLFALHMPAGLAARAGRRVALLFDSFRTPLAAAVRATGPSPRQLLYKAGRYVIRLRLEPALDTERMSIMGQLVDEHIGPTTGAVQDIAVLVMKGRKTLDRTLTNHLGEFLLEPDAAENLRLCVGVAEIGSFAVEPTGRAAGTLGDADVKSLDGPGRRRRARQR
ncbi:MAG TPA: hypothetical protein VGQ33_12670 [Vicinamibacteria bacterium]|nr:hypothetical protein [Vicinamibacteria bacterium]